MSLTLFNTLTKKNEKFVPLKRKVSLYTCGPTVYNYAHIGNLRAYVFTDILKRVLLFNKYPVNHVMNITDVGHLSSDADFGEDKMTKGLKREGLPLSLAGMRKLANKYSKEFKSDLDQLNIILPNEFPEASKYIEQDIEFIKGLEKKGFTYSISDGVYFDTSKLKDYGKLLHKKGKKNKKDEKVEQRIIKTEKRQPEDFALWKFNSKLGWSTPWGKGFPGWHIECSVMASHFFGKQFDIHCGGKEHIPIHHTNEIAQSEAAYGKKPWVKYWLHNEWLVLGKGKKMAKSSSGFVTLQTLQEKGYDSLDFRYFCLGTSYRNPLMFSWEALDGAKAARNKLFDKVLELKSSKHGKDNKKKRNNYLNAFTNNINDDLNTSKALATMWEVVKDDKLDHHDKYLLLLEFDKIFGFNLGSLKKDKVPAKITSLAEKRLAARKEKDWRASDELREKIRKLGWDIGDTEESYELKKK